MRPDRPFGALQNRGQTRLSLFSAATPQKNKKLGLTPVLERTVFGRNTALQNRGQTRLSQFSAATPEKIKLGLTLMPLS
jgi:hypothetical protein